MPQAKKHGVLPLPKIPYQRVMSMPSIEIRFNERSTMPERLERRSEELGISVEQLVKRFISSGMQDFESDEGPAIPGESLEDFLVKNGAWKK